jgi:hypothetical protein
MAPFIIKKCNIGKKPTTSATSTADIGKTEFLADRRTSTAKRPTSTASTAIHLGKPSISSISTTFSPTCTFDQKSSIRQSATETRLGYMPLDQILDQIRKVFPNAKIIPSSDPKPPPDPEPPPEQQLPLF